MQCLELDVRIYNAKSVGCWGAGMLRLCNEEGGRMRMYVHVEEKIQGDRIVQTAAA